MKRLGRGGAEGAARRSCGAEVARVGDGDCGVEMGCRGRGHLKGKAGDLGWCSERQVRRGDFGRIPLRERGKREEEDKTDRWVRGAARGEG